MSQQHVPDQSTASPVSNKRHVVLLTGGSRGIGAATALTFAQHGYDVILTYRNKAARAQEVVELIMQQGQRGLALACDMTNPDDVQRSIQQIGQWSEHLDARNTPLCHPGASRLFANGIKGTDALDFGRLSYTER